MRAKTIKGYKFLKEDMTSKNGTIEKWKLGAWKKHEGKLEMCNAGFHACESPLKAFQSYVYGPRLFIVEARGKVLHEKDDKFCSEEMRIVQEVENLKEVSVKFAIWAAKKCLKNFETKYPQDKRPRQAIEAAEAWLKEPSEENRIAASAAYYAAYAAADVAASAAAYYAAYAAASAAAYAAAYAAYAAAYAANAAYYAASAAYYAAYAAATEKKLISLIKAQLRKQKARG